MTNCKSFPPSVDNRAKVLILGSMPGVKSLEAQQYYAHPQNRFWKLMALLCNDKNLPGLNYKQRLKVLSDNHFALWDVIKFCKREGSLDSNIQSEIPNKIPDLLNKYKNIETIVLNGSKAYSSFKKHFPNLLKDYNCLKMPSTSPANAKYRLENLYKEWNSNLLINTNELISPESR